MNNNRNRKNRFNIFSYLAKVYLIFKSIYNFVDIITDLYLIFELWGVYHESEKGNRNTNVGLLILL